MRKPRDIDAELQVLAKRAKELKSRKVTQLGELVIATGAEVLATEVLAGALLAAQSASASEKEAWKRSGSAFFQGQRRTAPGQP